MGARPGSWLTQLTLAAACLGSRETGSITFMKTIQTILIGTLVSVAIAANAAETEAVKKDMARMQGEWVMVSGSADGQPIPEEMRTQLKRLYKGDELTVMMGEDVFFKAKITIDPSKKPKTIDYEMKEGVNAGKTQLGIYEFDGENFRSCFAAAGDERPKEFKAGEKRTLSEWKPKKNAGTEKAK